MKKSLIWTTAGIAAVGFGVPAFAARGDSHVPATVPSVSVAATTPATAATTVTIADDKGVDATSVSTANSVEDVRGNCDEAEHANDAACTGVTGSSVDDDATENSAEDVSGNCDEAEHANDAACTGQATTVSVEDNSGTSGADDNAGHNANDSSGRGSDDSGRHSNDG
jgi:hypothetical protein